MYVSAVSAILDIPKFVVFVKSNDVLVDKNHPRLYRREQSQHPNIPEGSPIGLGSPKSVGKKPRFVHGLVPSIEMQVKTGWSPTFLMLHVKRPAMSTFYSL